MFVDCDSLKAFIKKRVSYSHIPFVSNHAGVRVPRLLPLVRLDISVGQLRFTRPWARTLTPGLRLQMSCLLSSRLVSDSRMEDPNRKTKAMLLEIS